MARALLIGKIDTVYIVCFYNRLFKLNDKQLLSITTIIERLWSVELSAEIPIEKYARFSRADQRH